MKSKMTPRRRRGQLLVSLSLIALSLGSLSLAGCNKRADPLTANQTLFARWDPTLAVTGGTIDGNGAIIGNVTVNGGTLTSNVGINGAIGIAGCAVPTMGTGT